MNRSLTALCLVLSLAAAGTSALAADPAPMPQTKGMQGMDPTLHQTWDEQGKADPYRDCTPNAEKAAQAAKHPMPQTKGMAGMDPRAHEMDCAKGTAESPDPSRHVHKSGVN